MSEGDNSQDQTVDHVGDTGNQAEAETIVAQTTGIVSGTVIGRYKLQQKLGEGGFGTVYMAEQTEPVRRQVALKVIKLGMDTKEVIARFEAERQALALMDHPNIAKVLDAGSTETGRPYFVMELVRGVPLTEYCDEHILPPQERLKLFTQVCQAVQHAHQKGIIHRDIKPSNILVTKDGDKPVPKVIDFGIAKATAQRLTEQTMFTQFGQFIGTPAYMSPEQADPTSVDIDTRTDIYSLGVVLYELMIGSTPFEAHELRGAAFDEMRRVIREEEPPRPSTRISSMGEKLSTVAERRQLEPRRLRTLIRGDLDWIIMKALAKDRGLRYETANGFAMDIQRYLDNEPVVAGPPSVSYRAKKFVRRHRASVAAAGLAAVVLLAFAVTMMVQADRIAAARDAAEYERDLSEKVVQFQADMLGHIDPRSMGNDVAKDLRDRIRESASERRAPQAEIDEALADWDRLVFDINMTDAARTILDTNMLTPAVEAIEEEFADDPGAQGRLRHAVGSTYQTIGLDEQGKKQLEAALELRKKSHGPTAVETLQTQGKLGKSLFRLGQYAESRALLEDMHAKAKEHLGPDHHYTSDAAHQIGVIYISEENDEKALEYLYEALKDKERTKGEDSSEAAEVIANIVTVLMNGERVDEAAPLVERMVRIHQEQDGPEDRSTLYARMRHAQLLAKQKKGDEAVASMQDVIQIYGRVKGARHPSTLRSMSELASVLDDLNRIPESLELHQRVLDLRREELGESHPETLNSMTNLAIRHSIRGRHREAERLFQEALQKTEALLGSEHHETLQCVSNLGVTYWYQGRFEECSELFRRSYDFKKKFFGESHIDVAHEADNLAIIEMKLGRMDEGEALVNEGLAIRMKHLGPDHPETLKSRQTMAQVHFNRGRYEEAADAYKTIAAALTDAKGEENFQTLEAMHNLGSCYRRLERDADAEPVWLRVLELRRQTLGETNSETMDTVQELAILYAETDRMDEARPLFEEAIAVRSAAARAEEPQPMDLNDAAMLLLSCPVEELRDAALGLEFATQANELTNHADAAFLDTLASAHFNTGDVDLAVKMQRKAIEQLGPGSPDRQEYKDRLAEYTSAADDDN